jgi:hypothetical protein
MLTKMLRIRTDCCDGELLSLMEMFGKAFLSQVLSKTLVWHGEKRAARPREH